MTNNQPPLPPHQQPSHLLEINLISAQNLKPPSTTFRRLQTYAVVYINSNTKLRTRIDHYGGENPTWNDKFLFRVSDEVLRRETSSVTVDIFSVGVVSDTLLGSARFLISNVISRENQENRTPAAFLAVHVRRNSGRFQGVLNVGAAVIDGGFSSLTEVSAIGYVDMMGERRKKKCHRRGVSEMSSGSESSNSVDFSDGAESTGSSNSGSSRVLTEMNGRRDGRILCGLGFQKRVQHSISDDVINAFGALDLNSG